MSLGLAEITSIGVFVVVGVISIALLFFWWYLGKKKSDRGFGGKEGQVESR